MKSNIITTIGEIKKNYHQYNPIEKYGCADILLFLSSNDDFNDDFNDDDTEIIDTHIKLYLEYLNSTTYQTMRLTNDGKILYGLTGNKNEAFKKVDSKYYKIGHHIIGQYKESNTDKFFNILKTKKFKNRFELQKGIAPTLNKNQSHVDSGCINTNSFFEAIINYGGKLTNNKFYFVDEEFATICPIPDLSLNSMVDYIRVIKFYISKEISEFNYTPKLDKNDLTKFLKKENYKRAPITYGNFNKYIDDDKIKKKLGYKYYYLNMLISLSVFCKSNGKLNEETIKELLNSSFYLVNFEYQITTLELDSLVNEIIFNQDMVSSRENFSDNKVVLGFKNMILQKNGDDRLPIKLNIYFYNLLTNFNLDNFMKFFNLFSKSNGFRLDYDNIFIQKLINMNYTEKETNAVNQISVMLDYISYRIIKQNESNSSNLNKRKLYMINRIKNIIDKSDNQFDLIDNIGKYVRNCGWKSNKIFTYDIYEFIEKELDVDNFIRFKKLLSIGLYIKYPKEMEDNIKDHYYNYGKSTEVSA